MCYVARRNQAQTRELQNRSRLFRREIRKPGKSESKAANTRQRVVRKWFVINLSMKRYNQGES